MGALPTEGRLVCFVGAECRWNPVVRIVSVTVGITSILAFFARLKIEHQSATLFSSNSCGDNVSFLVTFVLSCEFEGYSRPSAQSQIRRLRGS